MSSSQEPSDRTRGQMGGANDQHLFERLEVFGLLEADGEGGWRLTERGRTSLATLAQADADVSLNMLPLTIRPWTPRWV